VENPQAVRRSPRRPPNKLALACGSARRRVARTRGIREAGRELPSRSSTIVNIARGATIAVATAEERIIPDKGHDCLNDLDVEVTFLRPK